MATCNLCGGEAQETLEAVGATRVLRCGCGLVFVTPQPPRPALEAAYDAAYYAPWASQAARAAIWTRRLETIARLAASPGRLLDVGCATGEFLGLARERGWEVQGTELSPYAVKVARAAGLPVTPGELWEAALPAEAFDVVTCWHVLEHVTDPRRVVREIRRTLRPGGVLVLATPNLDDRVFRAVYRLIRGRRPSLYQPDEREIHLFHFAPATLRRLVAAAGLDVLEIGFDRGAAAVWGKRLIDALAYAWFRASGRHWGLALELVARKPAAARAGGVSAVPGAPRLGVDGRELVPDAHTGIARYLGEVLRAVAREGWDCVVYQTEGQAQPASLPGLAWRRLPRRWTPWWDQVTLPRQLARDRVTVFLSPYYKGPLLAPCPVVLTIHDLFFIGYPGARRPLYDAAAGLAARLYARSAAAIIADSAHSRDGIVTRLGVDPAKITVVPVALGAGFRPARLDGAARQRYRLAGPYILYVGNFKPHKNLPRLLMAYAALPAALRDAHRLVLAGGDPRDRTALQALAHTLGIAERVHCPGPVDEADLAAVYSEAELFVLPSLEEGFGLPALEAMACGAPVVASDRGALPEVLDDAALLVDAEDPAALAAAMTRVLSAADLREELARRGRIRAAAFSVDRTAGRVVALLRDVGRERAPATTVAPPGPAGEAR